MCETKLLSERLFLALASRSKEREKHAFKGRQYGFPSIYIPGGRVAYLIDSCAENNR